MKKILLICSDIEGTYNALDNSKKIEMLRYIEGIKRKLGLDQTVFCFVSSASCKEIEELVNNNLLPILEESKLDTLVGPQFGLDGYIYEGSSPKKITKDSAKGTQMAGLVNSFNTFIPDSQVKSFIYIDDYPNINPILFLLNIDKDNKDLETVTFLVKRDEFSQFIDKDSYHFNINTIQNRATDFAVAGMEEINNIFKDTKKTR